MKRFLNVAAPVVIGVYLIAFNVQNEQLIDSNAYWIATTALILVGCVVWVSYGLADLDL